jgi:hypothetical protein
MVTTAGKDVQYPFDPCPITGPCPGPARAITRKGNFPVPIWQIQSQIFSPANVAVIGIPGSAFDCKVL